MRREPATVLAALLSLIPGGCIAALGNSETQYGMLISIVALPFYIMFVVAVLAIVPALVRKLGYRSMRAYLVSGCVSSLGLGLVLIEGGISWAGAAAGVICLFSAFMLAPFFENIGRTETSQ